MWRKIIEKVSFKFAVHQALLWTLVDILKALSCRIFSNMRWQLLIFKLQKNEKYWHHFQTDPSISKTQIEKLKSLIKNVANHIVISFSGHHKREILCMQKNTNINFYDHESWLSYNVCCVHVSCQTKKNRSALKFNNCHVIQNAYSEWCQKLFCGLVLLLIAAVVIKT